MSNWTTKKKEQFFLERMGEGWDFWSDAHAFVLVFVQRLPQFVCFLNMGEKRCLHPSFKALLRNYTAKCRGRPFLGTKMGQEYSSTSDDSAILRSQIPWKSQIYITRKDIKHRQSWIQFCSKLFMNKKKKKKIISIQKLSIFGTYSQFDDAINKERKKYKMFSRLITPIVDVGNKI